MAATAGCRLFIFGLGYTGLHVANQAQRCGWHVSGSCRSASKAAELQREHAIDVHTLGDGNGGLLDAAGLDALATSTHVLSTIPTAPEAAGDPVLRLHADALVSASATGHLRWAGYLSTTGVYGDHAGEWVDERSEARAPAGSSASGAPSTIRAPSSAAALPRPLIPSWSSARAAQHAASASEKRHRSAPVSAARLDAEQEWLDLWECTDRRLRAH
eukprot:3887400-Prymnesium_polylepis.1